MPVYNEGSRAERDGLADFKAKVQEIREKARQDVSRFPAEMGKPPGFIAAFRTVVDRRRLKTSEILSEISEWLERIPEHQRLAFERRLMSELYPVLWGHFIALTDLAFEHNGISPSDAL